MAFGDVQNDRPGLKKGEVVLSHRWDLAEWIERKMLGAASSPRKRQGEPHRPDRLLRGPIVRGCPARPLPPSGDWAKAVTVMVMAKLPL
jgi:hypothetical protein